MTQIKSQVRLVSEVLYGGLFEVPWHQRYYDWKVEHVKELLSDLKDALDNGKTCYFLGSIMLVRLARGKRQRINDGQQRLITLSLLIAALCRRFAYKRPRDASRETFAMRALFDREEYQASGLTNASKYQPRIEPPKNDKSRYMQIICGRDVGTNGLLTSAWGAIDIFIAGMSRRTMKDLFDFVMQKIEISVLEIPNTVDANSVFEALNARGKPLDDVDLIRNRLYSYFSEVDDSARRDTVHNNLESILVIGRSVKTVQDYFRCYLQCQYGYLQKTRFYRDARLQIEKAAGRRNPTGYVFTLVEGLGRNDSVELFRTISSSRPNQRLENRLPADAGKRDLAVILSELRGYKVSHPLVFALLHRFITESRGDRKRKTGRVVMRSLRNLSSFIMRTAFVATKFEPSRFEAAFSNCAQGVFGGLDLDSLDIMEDIERNDEWSIIDDSAFVRRMAEIEFRDNKKPLRYLFGINARKQIGSDTLREDRCSVEHVLPQSDKHRRSWHGFRDVDADAWIYRPGNLVIIARGENRSGDEFNASYSAKRTAFKSSALQMPREVAENYEDWTPEVIAARSRQLAKDAAATWKFVRARRR